MPKFDNAKDLERHLKKALDAFVFNTIKDTQGELGSQTVSPYETGRFRSSWFSQEGSPSREVAPEGADSPNTDAANLRVDSRKTYYLSNSLVYAQSVAIEGNVRSKAKTWFTSFRNESIPRIQQDVAKVVKQEFDL